MKIGLLMVGHVDPKSQHIAGDYPELFGALLAPPRAPMVSSSTRSPSCVVARDAIADRDIRIPTSVTSRSLTQP